MTVMKPLWESVVVGLICLIAGTVVFYGLGVMERRVTRRQKADASTSGLGRRLYLGLFLTGFLGHAFMELTGLNPRLYKLTGVWLW
jgi:hypothetical protein